ncbi:STAS domain-containing protein [Micromonospora zhanjiangensis]|uniref:Anti-sigma factor antagonist n=1 Tax=Micromonospora zhanjiangensis TaxID=1522057 RepID=A0ABV8KR51_9ACTN
MGDAVVRQQFLDDGTAVIELRGELDLAINDALRVLLVETVTKAAPARIVIDMLHVSFVDSTGIGALVAGFNAAEEAGIEYSVRSMAPFVERQLRVVGLYDQLARPE